MTHKLISILLLAIMLGACRDKSASNSPIKQYKLDGVVVSLNAQGHIANIDAQKVEGWMDAMTMDYPVKFITCGECEDGYESRAPGARDDVRELNYCCATKFRFQEYPMARRARLR